MTGQRIAEGRFDDEHPSVGQMFTCDACSENERPIVTVEVETEAYICEACWERHQEAVNAGAVALAAELGHTLAAIGLDDEGSVVAKAGPNTVRIARLVIDAYETAIAEQSS